VIVIGYEPSIEFSFRRAIDWRVTVSRLTALFAILFLVGCSASNKKPAASADNDDKSSVKQWGSEDEEDSASGDADSADSSSSDSDSDDDSEKGRIKYVSEKKLPPGPSCLDQQGNQQECRDDRDCCANFYCGIDPEGNTRVKVCLYGGK
jgi:hypothetical protein